MCISVLPYQWRRVVDVAGIGSFDTVMNIGALESGRIDDVPEETRACGRDAHRAHQSAGVLETPLDLLAPSK
jgi:hypothetical protein